jgi:hypothetical protein
MSEGTALLRIIVSASTHLEAVRWFEEVEDKWISLHKPIGPLFWRLRQLLYDEREYVIWLIPISLRKISS